MRNGSPTPSMIPFFRRHWRFLCLFGYFNIFANFSAEAAEPGNIEENFTTNPIINGDFSQLVTGTQSSFTHHSNGQYLEAILDVDNSPAYYISTPFRSLTDFDNLSFSFRFRITDFDDVIPPTSFLGLMTSTHVENFGDGMTLNLSTTDGNLVATSSIDDSGFKAEGNEIPLELFSDYLAYASYSVEMRQLKIDIFGGDEYSEHIGNSIANLPSDRTFNVNALGIQNGGSRRTDSESGSITLLIQELNFPGTPPINPTLQNVDITEGTRDNLNAVFQLQLSLPSDSPIAVSYHTIDVTAKSGEDYSSVVGTTIIPPRATTATIIVPIISDRIAEQTEQFILVVDHPSLAGNKRIEALATIEDDDIPTINAADTNIIEGDTEISFSRVTLSLSNPSTQTVTVNLSTSDLEARATEDYQPVIQDLIFDPGTTEILVDIPILGDLIAEGNESFQVNLRQPINATLGRSDATLVILDNDPTPMVTIENAVLTEGNSGPQLLAFPITLSGTSARQISVSYQTENGTAVSPDDFIEKTGRLLFLPGEIEKTVGITVLGDTVPEEDETFRLVLISEENAQIVRGEGIGTIKDNDRTPLLTVEEVMVTEGAAGTNSQLDFLFQLSHSSTDFVTVNYVTAAGTAGSGTDFESSSGTLEFPPGVLQQHVMVTVLGDEIDEPNETMTIQLNSAVGVNLGGTEATGTIVNDDGITFRVDDVSVLEGDSGMTQAVFTINLLGTLSNTINVSFFTSDISATAGIDYLARNDTISFNPGQTIQTISVPVIGDLLDEPEESFELNLSVSDSATLSQERIIASIIDNDPPSLSIDDLSIQEGSSGATVARFTLRASSATFEPISVDYNVIGETATSSQDFLPSTGTLHFPLGVSERSIDVTIFGDAIDEADETFLIALSNPINAVLPRSQATGTILDDDEAPLIFIENAEAIECDDGRSEAVFHISLSASSEQTVQVSYITDGDSAIADEDYVSAAGTVVFSPGSNEETITIQLKCDEADEPDEIFNVFLVSPINAFVGDGGNGGIGRGLILDNDPPEISIDGMNLFEGNSGFTTAVFTLNLSSPATAQSTVLYQTRDLTANGGIDYATVSGQIIFEGGSSTQTITVPIIGDTIPEGNESFQVILSDPVNLQLGQVQANGLILDDDQPDILVEDITVIEADTETRTGSILVRLSHTTTQTVSVDFESRGGTAIPLKDFANTKGTLFFAPGELEKEIQIVIEGDTVVEGNEFISMLFQNSRNGNIDRPESMIFIVDNDGAPIISIRDESTEEGNAPHNLVFTLRLSTASALPVSVAYRTADEEARGNEDYFGKSGTIRFPSGELTQIVFITISGDSQFEDDEAFFLVLSDPINGILERNQARATILNDDAPSLFSIENQSLLEGAVGQTPTLTFQVKLLPASSRTAEIDYAIVPESAIESEDYFTSTPNGTLTFPPGTTLQELRVSLIGDNIIEKDERFFIHLSNPKNSGINDAQAVGTILNDDGVSVHISDASILEPDQGEVTLLFPLTLAQPSSQTVTVNYATADGTAISNLDYQPSNGRISFPPGLLSQNLQINIKGDLLDEPNESLSIQLSNPINSVISRDEAFGVIVDNDPPRVTIDNVTVIGNRAGSVLARFTVLLSSPSAETVRISYFTTNGTATAGTDFSEQSGSLVFEAGNTELKIPIQVKGNTLDESDEHFFVHLSNPVGATLDLTEGRGTILNEASINIPPVVSILTPQDGDQLEDTSPIIISAFAHDEDGSVVEVSLDLDGEPIATLLNEPWSFVWEDAMIGNHTVTAIAKDDKGATATSNPVEFVITHKNLAPVINPPARQTTLEDVAVSDIAYSVGDIENPSDKLVLTASSTNSRLLDQSGITLEGLGQNRTISLSPLKDQFGETTINLTVRDLDGLTSIESFLLTVLPVNDPPTLDPITDVALTDNLRIVNVPIEGISAGPPNENDSVSISARELNSPSLIRDISVDYSHPNTSGILMIEMTDAASGNYNTEVTVIAKDEGGLEASTRFKISVAEVSVTLSLPADLEVFCNVEWVDFALNLENVDPANIAKVEYLIGDLVFEADGGAPSFGFRWLDPEIGAFEARSRVTFQDQTQAISHPHKIAVVNDCGEIAIVYPDGRELDDVVAVWDALLDLGYLPRVFNEEEISVEALGGFLAVIWHDLDAPELQPRTVDVLSALQERDGMPIYFIGTQLETAGAELPPETRRRWREMTKVERSLGRVPLESVLFGDEDDPNRSSVGEFWALIAGFALDGETDGLVTEPEAEVLAVSGDEESVLVYRFPSVDGSNFGAPRRFVQAFPLRDGGDEIATFSRRVLFENALCFLLADDIVEDCECPSAVISTNIAQLGSILAYDVGEEFSIDTLLNNNGRCSARGGQLSVTLPPGLCMVGVESSKGIPLRWEQNPEENTRTAYLTVGIVEHQGADSEDISLKFQFVATQPGSHRLVIRSTGNNFDEQTDILDVSVEGEPLGAEVSLGIERLSNGLLNLIVQGNPCSAVRIESSHALGQSADWQLLETVSFSVLDSERLIRLGVENGERFYRAIKP